MKIAIITAASTSGRAVSATAGELLLELLCAVG